MEVTRKGYIEYLIASPENYTCSNFAAHLGKVSHDKVSDFLAANRIPARELWKQVRRILRDSEESYLVVDDSVQDKTYSQKIELARYQWSGLEGGVIRGIGVVSLLHVEAKDGAYNPIDYRVYTPEQDGKTKNQHCREMLLRAVHDKGIQAKTVLFDSWYASVENFKFIQRLGLIFYALIKPNRLVSISQEGGYTKPDGLEWDQTTLQQGIVLKLKGLPFKVKLFKLVSQNGDIDWIVTNDPDSNLTKNVVKDKNAIRWKIEQLHREIKQLLGSQACQCRKGRSQRNHIALVLQAWVSLAQAARTLKTTLYQLKHHLWSEYLRAELANPRVQAFLPNQP